MCRIVDQIALPDEILVCVVQNSAGGHQVEGPLRAIRFLTKPFLLRPLAMVCRWKDFGYFLAQQLPVGKMRTS